MFLSAVTFMLTAAFLTVLLLLSLATPLVAQVVEATGCVYREGDGPQWAQRSYDDSGWDKLPPDYSHRSPTSRYLWHLLNPSTTYQRTAPQPSKRLIP